MLNSLFSRLFGGGPEEEERDEPVQPEEQFTAKPPLPPEPVRLELPPEHAVNRLRDLYREETGSSLVPRLCLEGRDGQEVMPAGEGKQELMRLQMTVNSTANQRVGQVFPKRKKNPPPEEEGPPPIPDLDAKAVVFVTTNRLFAWVLVYPPTGKGKEVDRELLSQALGEAKVSYGVDEGVLDRLPQHPQRYFRMFLAAQGQAAVDGTDGHVIELFPRKVERKVTLDEYNRVDYTSLNLVQNVEEGAVICRVIPPTKGTPGRTVLNQELPAKDGKTATLTKGRNTQLSEDGLALLASREGHVEFTGRAFQVKPLLEIGGNVDYSTGNIKFLGDVHIHGDVCSGFSVQAMGSITVDGVVEACSVEAGEDLVVVKGVQGDNQAVIRAHRAIYAKFLESSQVYVRELLQADCIINCDVYSNGVVQACSDRGTIIGGTVRAAREVNANIVGSRSESPTSIILGGQPCQDFDRDLLQREVAGMESELKKLENQPDSPTKFSRMSKTKAHLAISRSKLRQLEQELEELEELEKLEKEREQEQENRRLVCGIAYAGTKVTIDSVFLRLTHETRPCTAVLVSGEICLI